MYHKKHDVFMAHSAQHQDSIVIVEGRSDNVYFAYLSFWESCFVIMICSAQVKPLQHEREFLMFSFSHFCFSLKQVGNCHWLCSPQ